MTDSTAVFDPGWRLLDTSGDPVSGGKINFMNLAGSPINVYSDSSLSTSLGSTVYTGSDGAPVASSGSSTKVPVFIGAVSYKVTITDADDVDIFPVTTRVGALDTSGFLGSDDTTSVVVPVILTTGDLTLDATHKGKLIRCNTTGGALQITLPDAATVGDNWNVRISHDGDATAGVYNAVKIATSDSGQSITFPGGDATALALTARGEALEIACDGANFKCGGYAPIIRPNNTILSIVDRVTSAPSSPAAGARYIVSSAYSTFSTGDVIEADGQGGFIVYTPSTDCGWLAFVQDEDAVYAFAGSAWVQQYASATTSLRGLVKAADKAVMETATATDTATMAGVQHNHPGHPKAWANVKNTDTFGLTADYGVTSAADNGTGENTLTFDTAFSDTNYIPVGWALDTGDASTGCMVVSAGGTATTKTATTLRTQTNNFHNSRTTADSPAVGLALFGDQ